jgi:hypothetical protein
MTVRREVGGDHLGQRLVADSFAGDELAGLKWTEHRTTSQAAADLHPLQHAKLVALGCQEVVVDQRLNIGVGARNPKSAR